MDSARIFTCPNCGTPGYGTRFDVNATPWKTPEEGDILEFYCCKARYLVVPDGLKRLKDCA